MSSSHVRSLTEENPKFVSAVIIVSFVQVLYYTYCVSSKTGLEEKLIYAVCKDRHRSCDRESSFFSRVQKPRRTGVSSLRNMSKKMDRHFCTLPLHRFWLPSHPSHGLP